MRLLVVEDDPDLKRQLVQALGEAGYADARAFQRGADVRFKVQRFGFPDELPHMIQFVSGVERFKQMLRRST